MLLLRFAVLAAAMAAVAPLPASGSVSLAIGSICLSGVDQRVERGRDIATDGAWQTYVYTFESGGDPGLMAIFDRPIPTATVPENCQQTTERMRALGARVLINGRLSSLMLRADVFRNGTGNRLYIAPEAFVVGFRSNSSGLIVGGGTLRLNNTYVTLSNSKAIATDAIEHSGEIRIRPRTSDIAGARFLTPGGLTLVSDLHASGNLDLTTDLGDGVTRFRNGMLRGQAGRNGRGDFNLGVLAGQGVSLKADSIRVDADDGVATIHLGGVSGDAAMLAVPDARFAWSLGQSHFSGARIEALGLQTLAGLQLGTARVTDLSVTAKAGRLLAGADGELATGQVVSVFETISADVVNATSRWSAVRSGPLAPIFSEAGIDGLELALAGDRTHPEISGRIMANSVQAGGAHFSTAGLIVPIQKTVVTDQVVIPFKIDIPGATGSVKLSAAGNTALLTGQLHRFYLAGDIVIPLPNVADTHLLIARDQFRAGIGGAAALSPFALGTNPNLIGADVTVTNAAPLRIGKLSSGELTLQATATAIGEPVFKFGLAGSAQKFRMNLVASGGATYRYKLEDGNIRLARMIADASDIDVKLLEEEAIDLQGNVISQPRLMIASIHLDFDEDRPPSTNIAEMNGLTITATEVRSGEPGSAPGGIAYRGTLSAPVAVRRVFARKVDFKKSLVIDNFAAEGLSLALSNGWAEIGNGMRLYDVRLGLTAQSVTQMEEAPPAADAGTPVPAPGAPLAKPKKHNVIAGGQLRIDGRWRADSTTFSTNGRVPIELTLSLAGQDNELSGSGSFQVNAFTGSAKTAMVLDFHNIGFRCEDGDNLRVPFTYNFAIPTANIALNLDKGKLSGIGESAPFGVVGNTPEGGSTCESKRKSHTLVSRQEGWTWGVCVKRWRVKRCKWKWSTPALGFSYNVRLAVRFAGFTAIMTRPRYRLANGTALQICNEGPLKVDTLPTWGGFSPQFYLDGIPESRAVNWFVNAGLSITAEAAQSGFLTGTGNMLSWLSSVGDTTWNVGTTPFSGRGTCLGVSG
jgi:hypothetical protein